MNHSPPKQKINKNEIHLIFYPIQTSIDKQLLESFRKILSSEEKQKVDRYKFKQDQLQSLISRALLRSICSSYLENHSPDYWEFRNQDKGKPKIINSRTPFYFNLSHSGNLIALAISTEYELGVDIEYISTANDTASIANRYFSNMEIEALTALPTKIQKNHFFDYWTLKESYIKGSGQGLSIPLDSFSFDINHNNINNINTDIKLTFHQESENAKNDWQSFLLNVGRDYRGALSVNTSRSLSRLNIKTFTCRPLDQPQPITLPLDLD